MIRRNSYNEEFKRDSVRLSEKYGVKTAAKKLRVPASCLYSWRRIFLDIKAPKHGETHSYGDLLKEIKTLKKELSVASNAFYANKNSSDLIARPSQMYVIIQMTKNNNEKHSFKALCQQFDVAPSGFYQWKLDQNKGLSSRQRKNSIKTAIKTLFDESNGTYGSPRIFNALRASGKLVCKNTVSKYMKEMGLNANPKKKRKHTVTTDSDDNLSIAERTFEVENPKTYPQAPGEILAGDITYVKLSNGKRIYLAVVLDIFNREVLGWSLSTSLEISLMLNAMINALKKTPENPMITFDSDRGSQYASKVFKSFFDGHEILPSISRRGNYYNNAYVAAFFSTLKKENIRRYKTDCQQTMKLQLFEYIDGWYNCQRLHSSLDYQTPVQYRESYNPSEKANG
ncbi:MAG: IS3 family transposase [Proteobacteria bacterium]|nr:IS3 family transposase [Pseudomonadota bacterium]